MEKDLMGEAKRDASEYTMVAMAFAHEIQKGHKPADALHNASKILRQPLADNIADKTLLGHIKKHFEMTTAPRTNAEWKKAIRAWYLETFGSLEKVFREFSP
jgi:hypothetical protein